MNWAALLLADPSPSLRLLTLKNILDMENKETEELKHAQAGDPLIGELLRLQSADGSWSGDIKETAQALLRLGYLELASDHSGLQKGVNYLFSKQRDDGSWPLGSYSTDADGESNYDVMSLQTSIPLRALAACGYAEDNRSEKAYKWLLDQLLPDGSWPTGLAKGNYGYVAGYRKLAHSRWGCRSNTTSALLCLAYHPERRNSEEAQRALDLLISRETREQQSMGFEVARLVGAERARGFLTYYARFDMAQMLDLCWRVGASTEDSRVMELVDHVKSLQGPYGLWEYSLKPQASRWVTYDILRSLRSLKEETEWTPMEPRTPFQAYSRRRKRY